MKLSILKSRILTIAIALFLPLIAYSQNNNGIVPTIVAGDTLYCLPKERLSLISNHIVDLEYKVDSLYLVASQLSFYDLIIEQKQKQIDKLEKMNGNNEQRNEYLNSIIINKDKALADAGKTLEGYVTKLQAETDRNRKLRNKHKIVTTFLVGTIAALTTTTLIFSLK